MIQLLVRFAVGGTMVTLFALLADLIKPKSFARLFGALAFFLYAWDFQKHVWQT